MSYLNHRAKMSTMVNCILFLGCAKADWMLIIRHLGNRNISINLRIKNNVCRICFVQIASLRAQFYVLAKGSTRSGCPQREAKTWFAKSSFPVLKNWIFDEAEQCGNADGKFSRFANSRATA